MRFAASFLLVPVAPTALAQEARFPFDTPQIQLPTDSAAFQRLFDYDGDGDLDAVGGRVRILSGAVNGHENRVWTNDGSGAFQLDLLEFVDSAPPDVNPAGMPIAVGDLDGDGLDDFVQAAGSQLWRTFSPGSAGLPFEKTVADVGEILLDVQVADFDGDGLADVALLTSTRVAVAWSGHGPHGRRSTQRQHSRVSLSGAGHLIVLEGDGDALPDLLAVGADSMTVVALAGRDLRLASTCFFAHAMPMVAAGDIDGDGDTDIAAFYHATVERFLRTGPASWTAQPEEAGGPATALADIDGDGDADGVCCSGGGGGGSGSLPNLDFASDFEISLNDSGHFAEAYRIPGLGSRALAGAADVDGDGDVDLVAGRCVYFDRGTWEPPVEPGLDFLWSERDLADLDGDGDRDATREPTYFPFDEQVYASQGNGTYQWGTLDLEPAPGTLRAGQPRLNGDFDGDGDQDFILGAWDTALGHVVHFDLWRNAGGGHFAYAGLALALAPPYSSYGTAVKSGDFLIGDIQNDGDLDVVFVFQSTDFTTFVYLNDGSGAFALQATYRQEGGSGLIDLNQDGLLDLLTYGGTRYGTASGFGASRQEFRYTGSGTGGLIFEDFNSDGYPDLLLGQALLLNGIPLGAGKTFVAGWAAPTHWPYTVRMQALDADLDGRVDVFSGPYDTPYGAGRVYDFYRQRPGAGPSLGPDAFELTEIVFRGPRDLYGYPNVFVLRDDVDGDGDVDLIGDMLLTNMTRP